MRSPNKLITLAALLIGAGLTLFYPFTFGVNTPINDDWDHIETSLIWAKNGVSVRSLFSLHNEHCLAVPRLWNHLILFGTHGNFKVIMLLNAGVAVLLLGLLLWFVGTLRLAWPILVAISLAVALAVSSWCQWQNLLWAFQAPFFMLPLFTFGGALLIAGLRSDRAAFASAMAISWLSIFTNGNGLFVAWALVPVSLMRSRAASAMATRVWSVAYLVNLLFVTAVAIWLIARSPGKSHGSAADLLKQPGEIVYVALSVLGSAFVPNQVFYGENGAAFICGLLTLSAALAFAAMLWISREKPTSNALGPPLALAIYGLLSVAAVVYGRSQLLLANPIESRYQSFAIWWILGLLLVGCSLLPAINGRLLVFGKVLVCLIAFTLSLGTLHATPLFYKHGQNMRVSTESVRQVLKRANDPRSLDRLKEVSTHYGADQIRENLHRMEKSGLLHEDLSFIQDR